VSLQHGDCSDSSEPVQIKKTLRRRLHSVVEYSSINGARAVPKSYGLGYLPTWVV
jgi:hypothetical protein